MEVAQCPEADHAQPGAGAQVAAGHRLGHDGRRARRADGAGQQEVLVEAPAVAVGRQRPGRHPRREPVDRRADPLDADRRVGVRGTLGHQAGDRVARALDAVGRVAEDVDRAAGQVRRAHALGEHEHAGAPLGRPHRGAEPGEPRADDDDVGDHAGWATASGSVSGGVGRRCGSAGRCSTSSSPWKIQSSRRAWRSWSP